MTTARRNLLTPADPSTYTTRAACSACGTPEPRQILTLGETPLADVFPATADETETTYPLRLQHCRTCGLVQLADVVPDQLLYGHDYGFSTGNSPAKQAANQAYAEWLTTNYRAQAAALTVEIAANDGDLLHRLDQLGARTVGIDPAPTQTQYARDRGIDMHTAAFTSETAVELRDHYGPAGLIIAHNVLAHVADPHDFMAGVAALLSPTGTAIIQVQYLGDLIGGNQWDHIYHEHRAYFSINPLALLAMKNGMSVRRIQRVPEQGGSIRVFLRHGVGYGDPQTALARYTQGEQWLTNRGTYDALQGRVDYCQSRLIDLVDGLREAGETLAGWAATAKSSTLLNYCDFTADHLTHVVDLTPGKVGRYTPGTRIPIVAPDTVPDPDVYLMLGWNYLGWALRHAPHYCGRWLVPIPYPTII